MSGPTGFEEGGARTLVKTATYTQDSVPPADYPSVGSVPIPPPPIREVVSSPTTSYTIGFVTTDSGTGQSVIVVTPSWGAPGVVMPNPF